MIDADAAEYEVLISAEEESGLYEIIWSFNTIWPEAPVGEKYAMAEVTVRRLLSSGCVELWRTSRQGNERSSFLVPKDEAILMLSNPVTWYPSLPEEPPAFIEIGITPQGEDRLRTLATRRHGS
jgi:hypothetical protein